MKRLTVTLILAGICALALAMSSYHKAFLSTYNIDKDSKLAAAKCMVCHVSNGSKKLNAYGQDLAAAMKKADTKKLTPEILHSIDNLDSDKDGVKNGDQIRQGRLPGGK